MMVGRRGHGVGRGRMCCGRLATWDDIVAVSTPGDVTGPQIVIDNAGFVYVIWTDFAARQLRIARSLHPAAALEPGGMTAFDTPQPVATSNRTGAGLPPNSIAAGIPVIPRPSARQPRAANPIAVPLAS